MFFGLFAPFGTRGMRRQEWFHSLSGYLQVGSVVDLRAELDFPAWLCDHPHVTPSALESYQVNLPYIAREGLEFAPESPGWDVFRYQPELRLTPADAKTRTVLELPACLGSNAGASVTYLSAHLWTTCGHALSPPSIASRRLSPVRWAASSRRRSSV